MIELRTERLILRSPRVTDCNEMASYRVRNKEAHAWTEPARGADYFRASYWETALANALARMERDEEYRFIGFEPADPKSIVCLVNLYNVVRGPIQTALMGYSVDVSQFKKGIATEAVTAVVKFAFTTLDLKRIEAGVLPENLASVRVLEKTGYRRVGVMQQSLRVMGEWRDHDLYDQINPQWKGKYV